jgi:hypothetical protein
MRTTSVRTVARRRFGRGDCPLSPLPALYYRDESKRSGEKRGEPEPRWGVHFPCSALCRGRGPACKAAGNRDQRARGAAAKRRAG